MRNKLAFLLVAVMLLLAACGTSSDKGSSINTETDGKGTSEGEKTYKIGVTQIVEHPSLDAAYEGFQAAFTDAGIEAEFVYKTANGDNNANMSIAQSLVGDQVDLIFANSTPSAQAAKSATSDIPIVFTSVTDAIDAQLIYSMEEPGGNVTGTIDLHPDTIASTVAFMKNDLGATKIGTVYNSGEQNSIAQIAQVKQALANEGLELVEASVATSAEVKQATESLIGKVDALYIVTDNTVVSALESVIDVAKVNNLPAMVGELDSVARGGLGAYGFEYYDIGYEAGQMAVQILKDGKSPSEVPAAYPANLKLVINKGVADALGLEIKDTWNAEVK
ncbi:ABC transporter substrate-binding protein [Metasolibacillus meyeri]|uniref:ABC transporter substrate-binding protein n=1 Tax=Metasolibacillus meyeri TaxID=1071052 RepID=A0AAW9NNM9_9BACL|nr:ABC transporter substrate-binding protein [Metasolibacillus meyeri]MEC1176934.1 ABC transporter substrate-binding protein [Metasolibacillus meyeri]